MKVTAWLTRKVGPLPMWAWPVVAVGGFVAYRYLKSRQAANAATSGTAVPIGGSPFNFPDYSQPDAGLLLPTSSLPTGATTSTNGGGGTSADSGSGTSSNSGPGTPAGAPSGSGPGGQSKVDLTSPPPNFYKPVVAAPATAPTETRINLTAPHPNYYTPSIPTSAMPTTAGAPGGQTRRPL